MKIPPYSIPVLWKTAQKIACLSALTGLATTTVSAATVYWDQNLGTAGFLTTASTGGVWNTSAFWTADTTGNTGPWNTASSGDDFVFASGLANTSNAVSLTSSLTANSLSLRNGRWAFTGAGSPTLTLGAGGLSWTVPIGGTASGNSSFANTLSIVLGASQTWNIGTNNATNNLTVAGGVAGNASTGNTTILTLTGGVGGSGSQFTGQISDGSNGGNLAIVVNSPVAALTATDSTYQITGSSNTYSGKTTVQSGMLRISSLTDVFGGGSSLGSVSDVSLGTIDLGGTAAGGLIYNSTVASSSDRIINLAGTAVAGGAVLKNASTSATATLTLTGGVTNTGVAGATKTLTLGGVNTGANTISGVIADGVGADKTAVSKIDAGFWALSGNNTYTGGTTITLGTLSVGASGNLGANVVGNNISIAGGNLLLNADTNVGSNQTLTITAAGGGIGVSYLPTAFPTITDNSGATGGVFGLNYVGTGGIGTVTPITNLFGPSSFWFLGSFVGGSGTYTGASLAVGSGSNYRLGGGGGALTIQNNILTGANNLIVGSTGGGIVNLSNANTYTGNTTLQNGTLNVSSIGSVGGASSSLGAQTTAGAATINIGSGANVVTLNYTGAATSTDRILNFSGTTGTATVGNSGTGNLVFTSGPTFTGNGAKTVILGNATDTFGGSIGAIKDSTAKTSLTKAGLTNSRWVLTGGAGNTFTGNTSILGGVLETAALSDLATSYVTISGASTTQYAVWQSQGTLTRVSSATAAAANINVGGNAGFAAKGGTLTVNLGGGSNLIWANGFGGGGGAQLVFGSATADSQVLFMNNLDFGAATAGFNRQVFVDKGTGGDSATMSGILSAADVGAAGNNGLVKNGNGTLILSGNNTYSGSTLISAGTLVAGSNVSNVVGTAGAFGDAHLVGAVAGTMNLTLGDGNTTLNNSSASLLTGSAVTIARAVTIANQATTGIYSVGGSTDTNSFFTGAITTNQNLTVSQVATTGTNTVTISGGITGGATAATKTVTFNNIGRVMVATVAISDGGGGGKIAVNQIGSGTTTLAATNTYTGATTISAGTLLVNGSTAAGSAVALNGGKLGGAGTVNGLVTSAGTVAHIAPGNSPGTLTLAGGLNAAAGLSFDFELGTVSDLINTTAFTGSTAAGGLVFNFTNADGFAGATPYTLLNFSSQSGLDITDLVANIGPSGYTLDSSFGTGGWLINANNLQVQFASAVPEPSTYALILSGLGFLYVLRRKAKKTA